LIDGNDCDIILKKLEAIKQITESELETGEKLSFLYQYGFKTLFFRKRFGVGWNSSAGKFEENNFTLTF